jgi:hypothetical protein
MERLNALLKQPWSNEVGDEVDRLTYKYLKAIPGKPLFSSVIVDCEVVVYLDIADDLLKLHCERRNFSFTDSMNCKIAIEGDWDNHKKKGGKILYYIMLTE